MDFLGQQNRRVAGDAVPSGSPASPTAKGKHVVVIGGGDTGSDCVGTSIRQGAARSRNWKSYPSRPRRAIRKPLGPMAADHADFLVAGRGLPAALEHVSPRNFAARRAASSRSAAATSNGCRGAEGLEMGEIPGTEFTLPAELVLIAMGFVHVVHAGLIEELGLELDDRGNVVVNGWMSSEPGVFASGDTVGARCWWFTRSTKAVMAAAVDEWLRQ